MVLQKTLHLDFHLCQVTKSAMIKKALAWEQIQNNEQQVARKKLNQNDADLDKNEEGAEDGLKNKEGGSTNMG